MMEWYRATGLRPYLDALSHADKREFENDIFIRLINAYPKRKSGEIVLRFPRLSFIAVK